MLTANTEPEQVEAKAFLDLCKKVWNHDSLWKLWPEMRPGCRIMTSIWSRSRWSGCISVNERPPNSSSNACGQGRGNKYLGCRCNSSSLLFVAYRHKSGYRSCINVWSNYEGTRKQEAGTSALRWAATLARQSSNVQVIPCTGWHTTMWLRSFKPPSIFSKCNSRRLFYCS